MGKKWGLTHGSNVPGPNAGNTSPRGSADKAKAAGGAKKANTTPNKNNSAPKKGAKPGGSKPSGGTQAKKQSTKSSSICACFKNRKNNKVGPTTKKTGDKKKNCCSGCKRKNAKSKAGPARSPANTKKKTGCGFWFKCCRRSNRVGVQPKAGPSKKPTQSPTSKRKSGPWCSWLKCCKRKSNKVGDLSTARPPPKKKSGPCCTCSCFKRKGARKQESKKFGPNKKPAHQASKTSKKKTSNIFSKFCATLKEWTRKKPAPSKSKPGGSEAKLSEYTSQIYKNFTIIRIFLLLTCRFPFTFLLNEATGDYTIRINWCGVNFYGLILQQIFMTYFCAATFINLMYIYTPDLDEIFHLGNTSLRTESNLTVVQKQLGDVFEWELICRHLVIVLATFICLVHNVQSGFCMPIFHKHFENFFITWKMCLRMLKLDLGRYVYQYTMKMWMGFFGVIIFLALYSCIFNTPTTKGGSYALAASYFRNVQPFMFAPAESGHAADGFAIGGTMMILYKIFAILLTIYIHLVSKSVIFLFIFGSKLFIHAMTTWQARVHRLLANQQLRKLTKEDCDLIWKEYCIMIQLHEGTSKLMTGMLESYMYPHIVFITWFFTFMIKQWFYLIIVDYPTVAEGQGMFLRTADIIPLTILFVAEAYTFLYSNWICACLETTSVDAMNVTLRERSFAGDLDTAEESNLLTSLFWGYANQEGWGIKIGINQYTFDMLAVRYNQMLNYLIIWHQFQMAFASKDKARRTQLGLFLSWIEGASPECHWCVKYMNRTEFCPKSYFTTFHQPNGTLAYKLTRTPINSNLSCSLSN